ncbi:2-hydroxychromene-2-carboxylate isomerase [Polaromonas sp. YR568]|uniref:2-hydroxychromene-2-carboxylate isomerase n=1 Tax=Polaromonas sp. YR568 TaxID=1855301 RepID=UPI0008F04439|nr:2-hydroxychromene-2-carboxylate isomerase [Polaromonas sp. YR568]SFU92781.1 2-hydroxychromene-2-carboxylate isomerase [Polaromonas sp. YR568]
MKHITFYFDFISPYAYLAFEHLPEALKGLSYSVSYRPVLFAAMLKHHGQLGPAEIAPKRDWTYRQALWHAHSKGIAMKMPASHPFNPLPLLRLASSCGTPADPAAINRYVCEAIFRHVWQGGAEAADEQRLAALTAQLAPQQHLSADEAKAQLKKNTDDAIALNLFGVPAMEVDGKVFWGFDALPMLREYLLGNAWFDSEAWHGVSNISVGISRKT